MIDLSTIKNKITDYEKAIIEKLKEDFIGFFVDEYVKNPKDFYLRHPQGALLVHFSGSNYSGDFATDLVVQDRILTFEIILSMKHLKSDSDIQDVLDAVRLSLTGFQPLDTQKMRPIKDRFVAEDNGAWLYGITFGVKGSNIEIDKTDWDSLPKLNQVTYNSEEYDPIVVTSTDTEEI